MTEELKGIILKISFGEKSDEYADTYLAKLRDRSTYWCTPRRYAGLDGKGRKLIF